MARINMQAAGFTPEMLGRPPQEQAPRPALSQGGALSRGAPMARPTRMQSQPGAAQGIPAEYYMPAAYSAPPNYPISAKRAMWSDLLYDVGAIMQGQAPTSPHRTRMEREHLMAQERMQQMRTAAANRYKYQNVGDRLYRIDQFTGQADPVTEAQKDYGFQESGDVLYRTDKTTGEAVAVTDAPEPGGIFEGKGMPQQMFNALTNPDPNVRNLVFSELTKPRTLTNPEGTYTLAGTDPAALNAIIAGAGYEPIGAAGAAEPAGGSGGSGQAASAGVVPTGFTAKPPTEAQTQSLAFYSQMAGAQSQLDDILSDESFDPTTFLTRVLGEDGSISTFANYAASPQEQRFARAAERWIRGKLRRESGAAIGVDEARNEFRAFFPMPGDADETLRDKAAARARSLRTMGQGAGPAAMNVNPLDQVYVTDNGNVILRSDIEATAQSRGISPEEALEQAIEAGTIRSLIGN